VGRIHSDTVSVFTKKVLFRSKGSLIILVFLLTFLPFKSSYSQDNPEYEEIALFLDVPGLGGGEMDVLILDNEVYLPITDLFDFLMIRNISSPGMDSITGFFIHQEATYLIERDKNQIRYGNELFELKPGDIIRTETNLYLSAHYFGHIFGLNSDFNFRTLSVRINTQLELPAIREMRQQAMRKNIKRLAGEVEADTIVERRYPIFHFGMADWSANIIEQLDGPIDARLGLAVGSIIAGGEATAILNYNTYAPFQEKQQYYLWRYVNNDNKAVRQVMAGKIATGATSSIYNPVVGGKITNASTKFRRSFGTYTLSDRTEPEWIVELYVNNVLVDYTTADAAGFFTFEVPLVYGNTQVRLKFYGPYGEERTREQNITIPFNFIPNKTVEYSVSAGMVQDNLQSTFSRASVFYGLTRSITMGTGVEYLSSVSSGEVMPFVNSSIRLASNLLFSGEYSPAVRSLGTLTYRLPSSLQFDINYINYTKGQKAINNNFREERKFSMSMPVRYNNLSLFNRLSINQLVLPTTNYTTSEWLISGAFYKISTNLTTYGVFISNTEPYFYSDFSMSFRLPKDISVQPRVQYTYTKGEFISAKVLAEKRVLKKGYLTASYEQNFRSSMYVAEIGFRYDLKFAQTSFTARHFDRNTSFIQYARGSIINDGQNNYVHTDNRGHVGKGAISIIPFLDKNGNGTREPGEPKVYGLNIRTNAGRIEKRDKDTTIRIFNLEPYSDCYIEFDQNSFDNIAWRLKDRSMSVIVDPNMVKLVEIPIIVVGEAAGMVMFDQKGVTRGLARMIVNFYDKDEKIIGRTLSEEDGYFSYFGFKPGTYDARIDSTQLSRLGMVAIPQSINFTIDANIDGDYLDGLDFLVKSDSLKQIKAPETKDIIIQEDIDLDFEDTQESYAIETGAFKTEAEADTLRNLLSRLLGIEVGLFNMDGLYKVRVTGLVTRDEVEDTFPALQSIGINEIELITFNGMLKLATGVKTPWVDIIPDSALSVVVVAHEILIEDTLASIENYTVEIGTFKTEAEADALRIQLSKLLGREIGLFTLDNLYKVRVTGLGTRDEVEELFPVLESIEINEIGLITVNEMLKIATGAKSPWVETIPDSTLSAVIITHETINEDALSPEESYTIEIGTFATEGEAGALRIQLSKLLGKEVSLFSENALYNIKVTGFETEEEVEETFPVLRSIGINEIRRIIYKGMVKTDSFTKIQGTETGQVEKSFDKEIAGVIIHEIFEEDSTSGTNSYAIQLGAFKIEENANRLRNKIASLLDKEVVITVEDEFSKVRVTGFKSSYEVERYIPALVSHGINEIWVVTLIGTLKPDITAGKPDIHREVLSTFKEKDTIYSIIHDVFEDVITTGSESFSIQVGAFNRKINADALRVRLAAALGKEVEIFVEDALYKVRIIGFETRDEAETYLPILHNNGISDSKILKLNEKQSYRTAISRLDTISDKKERVRGKSNSHLINKKRRIEDVKKTTSDGSAISERTVNPQVIKKELPTIPEEEKAQRKAKTKETPIETTIAERPKKETVAEQAPVERVKTLEERLLEAEYRSGAFESRWPGVEFTVQIASSKSISDPEVIKKKFGLSGDVEVVQMGEWYRFTINRYVKYWQAREYRNILKSRFDIEDAFVVAYRDGKRIMLTDLVVMAESSSEGAAGQKVRPDTGIGFSVQVLATKDGSVSESGIREKFEIEGDIFKEYDETDGLYRYSIGNYSSYIEAAQVRNKVRLSGYRDAFVVGYKDGKRLKDIKSIL
jgi:cell division protein FtsN